MSMEKENKSTTKRFRISEREKKKFDKNFQKSGFKTESEYIRSRILSSERQEVSLLKRALKQEQEHKQQSKMILAGMCSIINQLKAGVDTQNVLMDLKKGVDDLCHALR